MGRISEKIIELRIATRHACRCEQQEGAKKSTLSLKSKLLFCLLDKPSSPAELMSKLLIGKTNLAIMARQLCDDGFLTREQSKSDRRTVIFAITDKGRRHVEQLTATIETMFTKILTTPEEYDQAIDNIDTVIDLLSFLS